MNCEETQNQLSAYLDGGLDEARHRMVEEHLAGCSHCRAELAALRRTIASVSGLGSVEPPPGFSQRVMAQVRDEARRPSRWRSFLFPLWAKLPLQAATVLLIAGLAVYLYELNRPAPIMQTPAESPSPPPMEPVPIEEGVRAGRNQPTASLETAATKSKAADAPSQKADRFAPSEKEAPSAAIGKSIEMSDGTSGATSGTAGGLDAPARSSLEKKAAPFAADRELALATHTPLTNTDQLTKQLAEIAKQVGGAILEPPVTATQDKLERQKAPEPYTVWLTVPPDRYAELKTRLASLGAIESDTPGAPAMAEKFSEPAVPSPAQAPPPPLRIKLTIRARPQQAP